jgi:hypothetical protein
VPNSHKPHITGLTEDEYVLFLCIFLPLFGGNFPRLILPNESVKIIYLFKKNKKNIFWLLKTLNLT